VTSSWDAGFVAIVQRQVPPGPLARMVVFLPERAQRADLIQSGARTHGAGRATDVLAPVGEISDSATGAVIRRLKVSNFRSLGRDVDARLGRLTALVGPNGSGKSNVVDALQFLADCMHIRLEGAITKRHGLDVVRRFSEKPSPRMSFRVEVDLPGGDGVYEFELASTRKGEYSVQSEHAQISSQGETFEYWIKDSIWLGGVSDLRPRLDPTSLALPLIAGDKRFSPLADTLRHIAVYSIYPDTLREPQKYDPTKPMDKHGSNWASILKDQDPDTWKDDVVEVLSRLTGDVVDIRVQPIAGYLTVQFEHMLDSSTQRRSWLDPIQESDGTLRVAGMITALLQLPRPTLIALEEPELTVHPGALRLLRDYVQQTAEHGQVVITTHSPDLLDLLDTDSVRVVARRNGATTVEELDEDQRDAVKSGLFSLGDVFRSEGLKQRQLTLPLSGE
jgi:predicted ATPase